MERRPNGHFGFARRSTAAAALPSADTSVSEPEAFDGGQGEAVPEPMPEPVNGSSEIDQPMEEQPWVVRPKVRQRSLDDGSPSIRKPRRRPGYINQETAMSARSDEPHAGAKRWLALGLAGMVYVTGAAGLWSMVQMFDDTSHPPMTPADDIKGLPPLDSQVDLQDARLDGPIIPRFRPDLDTGDGEDVATSDLQKKG